MFILTLIIEPSIIDLRPTIDTTPILIPIPTPTPIPTPIPKPNAKPTNDTHQQHSHYNS